MVKMRINRDQIILSRWKNLQFHVRRGQGHMLAYLVNRFKWHFYPRLHIVSEFPDHIDVEISSACDMRCPMCYTITKEFNNVVKRKFMPLNNYKKIIDECISFGAYSIRISLRGEPFIHKDAIEMIRYAKEKGIKEVSSLTNNLALTPELFEKVMKAGLDWLVISFDGLREMYEQVRKPAKFVESYNKIKEYKRIKEKAGSVKPALKVQSVWPAIKDNALEYYQAFEPYVDSIASNPLVDYLHKDKNIEYIPDFDCPVLYQRLVIGSDGIALLCSNDEMCTHPIGDTNKEPLYNIWHGEIMTEARALHHLHLGVEKLEPCQHCYLPRKTEPAIEFFGKQKIIVEKLTGRSERIGE